MNLGLEAGSHTLDLAIELGIRGVPISAEALVNDGVERTLQPLREHGLSVCQIGAFGFNPLSTDRERQAKQAQMLEQAIPLALETGCRYLVINGGNYHPSGFGAADARNFTPDALDTLADTLTPFVQLAERHRVCLSIEPYLKTAINSPERFHTLKAKVGSDALRANIDVTSLYDFGDMVDPTLTVEEICTGFAGHYGLGHIKDIGLNEGFHIHMGLAPLGSSPTDWSQVLRLMAPHMPEDSWVILEHISSPEEARASLVLLQEAAARADVILH
jgi:sugar phosphate isomerase/epimerase